MEKKIYRNALRSKAMIRAAFIELLKEKPLEQITVVDIVNRSDLSRNTFYAHYQDIYAVLEEYQGDAISLLNAALDEAVANHEFDDPLPLLQKVAEHVENNKATYRVLLNADKHDAFIAKIKGMLIDRIIDHFDTVGIQNKQGFLIFMEILATGFVHLVILHLRNEVDLTADDIIREINRIFHAGVPLYRSTEYTSSITCSKALSK